MPIHRKQCVYIVRYGQTKFLLAEDEGPFDSDITPEGCDHAKSIATCIASDDVVPVAVYSSPFQRCAHTAQLIALELPKPLVRIEEGLTEWLTPSLLVDSKGAMAIPKTVAELANMYGTIDDTYESLNPVVSNGDVADVPEGSPKYEESEDALLKRCAKTVELLLQEHSANGDSFAIVSHAPCDQAVAIHLEGATSTAESLLGPWPLGGITKFSRILGVDGRHGEWTLEKYADTEHMPGKYKPGIKEWSLPCLSKDQQNQ